MQSTLKKASMPPQAGELWRLLKGRGIVTVQAITNERATSPDLPRAVVYRDEAGNLWSRPESDFVQSYRFTFARPPKERAESAGETVFSPSPWLSRRHPRRHPRHLPFPREGVVSLMVAERQVDGTSLNMANSS